MLSSDTKRLIDAARDYLVGVVPNPLNQIEQITFALIYKFMYDMDKASLKAGGKASFFTGSLKEYSWDKLIDSRLGNHEKFALYSDALEKFAEAKQLPELFRSIFKSAFLPYKAPETLGMFLKVLNKFDYNHPEDLGNAYEYLLSIMSSQGDAGQFRTPRHIIKFMVDVMNPKKTEKILDPACGTGGFLIYSYRHIVEQHDGKDDPKGKEKPLTPDDRKKLMQNLEGYDIDPSMVRMSQVNMYLHQFKNPQIFQYDTLTSEDRWNDKYDVILANPPFMSPRGGILPHNKFSVASTRAEVLFVDYIINHLKPKGRAGIIVPEGINFQRGNAYKALRKNLVENGLYAVVSLPGGVFNPYSGVKTSILLLNNELSKQKSEIAFVKISTDGYDLGATKREISQNDLPLALELLKAWADGKSKQNAIFTLVSKEEIAEKGDYNLSGDRYLAGVDHSNILWPIARLNSICTLVRGVTFAKKDEVFENGQGVLTASNLKLDGTINLNDLKMVSKELNFKDSQKLIASDIFICLASGSQSHVGKVAYVTSHLGLHFGGFMGSIRVDITQVNSKYLYYQLKNVKFNDYLSTAISGANIRNLSTEILGSYEIPLPPIDVQEEIVAELDGYAAIISGAKQIVESWKPKIDIDPEWGKTRLGDVLDIQNGYAFESKAFNTQQLGLPLIRIRDINTGFSGTYYEGNYDERYLVSDGDLLIGMDGDFVGTLWQNGEALLNQRVCRLQNFKNVDKKFILYSIQPILKIIQDTTHAVTVKHLSSKQIEELEIPLPSLAIQQSVVRQIDLENESVVAAQKLIETFENKTQTIIAKLWSE